jgi:hypothetical protein
VPLLLHSFRLQSLRSRSPRACAIAFAASFVTLGSLADAKADPHAGGAEPAEARAEARFRDGSEAFDKGRIDEACADFEASLRLYPTLGTLLNLALCHETEGKTASAWREFTHAAAWANQDPNGERREFAHQHALRLEHSLARVMLDVAGGSRNANVSVQIDGTPVDPRTALPIYLDPGTHTVVASAPGRTPLTQTITVPKAGSADAVAVHVPALDAASEEAPASAPDGAVGQGSSTGRRTAAYAVGGAGALLFAFGVYFGIDAISKTQSLGSQCKSTCDSGPATASAAASLVTLGLGTAGLAVGTYLWAAPPPAPSNHASFAPLLPRITPLLTPTSASVQLGWAM